MARWRLPGDEKMKVLVTRNPPGATYLVREIALWAAQGALSAFYVITGAFKMLSPIEDIARWIPWTADHPVLARFTGFVDVAGGVGILLPGLLGIFPSLTIWAAGGLSLLQLMAITFHVMRAEPSYLPLNGLALALSLLVLWGRFPCFREAQRGSNDTD